MTERSEKHRDCLLTLVFPASLEETIVEHLLDHEEWAASFSAVRVEGHGHALSLRDPAEQVRGRSRRLMVQIAINGDDATRLVEHFRDTLPNPEIVYWRVPLSDYGRFS